MQNLKSQDFLAGDGEMAARMRAKDWSTTPLGPVENWPQSLKTVVRIILTSRQPMFVWWGPHLINLYNDPYKAIVGGKHPAALGQPASVVWREIWEQVGPRAESVMLNNEGTYDEALLLIMERNGYLEETYYTFSYSPIPRDTGGTDGIICANTDDTQRIIGERQLKLLRELATGTVDARTSEEACKLSATYLSHNPYDLPFALLYLVDTNQQTVQLVGASGISENHQAAVTSTNLRAESLWPFSEVISKKKTCVVTLPDAIFKSSASDSLINSAWGCPPRQAVAVPIPRSGQTGSAGILIVGLNPFRLFDDNYAGFIDLVARQIASSLANAQAYEEERRRAEALAEIDRAKTIFFSNISHEFRTPLTLMLGPIEDMLNEESTLATPRRERLETLHRNSLRLLKLVNTLLDFSRIEAGRVQAVYRPTDIASYTAELASTFRSAVEKAGIELLIDCAPLTRPVYVDHDMWEKIVLNLLSNAFKYTFNGEIKVSLQQAGDNIELRISDTGTGIPESELSHIFERFHRVQNAQGRTYEGTGIGLSLVQELVKLHSGAITVQSKLGRGSTFTVTIPTGLQHLPEEQISQQSGEITTYQQTNPFVQEALRWLPDGSATNATEIITDLGSVDYPLVPAVENSSEKASHRPKILLADDNADMREYVTRLLSSQYIVQAVANGQLAIEAALADPPNLVLTDVMMPQLDGFSLLKELRAHTTTHTIPIIMLSARAGQEAQIEGLTEGADDYLVKPFSARELLARVGSHIEMARLRREASRKLHELQEQLTSITNNSPIALWSLDKQGIYTLAQGKGLAVLGMTSDQLVGKSHYELYKDEPEFVEAVKQALQGESLTTNIQFGEYWFETNLSPTYAENGEITGVVAVSINITERKKAELERERILSQFEAVLEQMPAGVIIAQALDGKIILSNKQAISIMHQPAIGLGSRVQDGLYHGLHTDETPYKLEDWPLYRSLTKGESVSNEEITIVRDDGTIGTISKSASPIRDANGKIIAAAAVFIDITERKLLERQKDEFIAIASHELKTPVTSLKAYGQVLQASFKRKGDLKAVAQLAKMDTQINKLTGLIRDLLDVTKLQAGKLRFQEELFDFNELVNETVEELQRTTEQHNIIKELDVTKKVYGDRDRIGQVLINLVSNAIKYSPYADKVIIRTIAEKSQITLSVQDFGIGIDPSKHAYIFNRFYRVNGQSQETFSGMGLGLYISAQIISQQNGRIWLESSTGQGSTFYFSLPAPVPE